MDDPVGHPPTAAALNALAADDWAAVLAVALPVVRQLPERLVDAAVRRVVAVPPGRLAAGRSRADLAAVLARPEVWALVETVLPDDAARPWAAPVATPETGAGIEVARLEQQVTHLQERETRLAARVTDLRGEVEELRRERDGAVARAGAAERAATAAQDALAAAEAARDEALAAARDADERVARAAARTRRRDEGEVAGLREDLRRVRRERDELRSDLAAARERLTDVETALASAPAREEVRDEPDPRAGRRGRPSRLPDGVAPGTTRAAAWLVSSGRVLLVDGYNVSRSAHPELSFEAQRRWLEDAVGALAARRHVDATIVWDASHGRPSTRRRRSGVTVRFTRDGVTADDELVYHVEVAVDATTPVVVVTDDAELRTRLARHGVDLLDSTSFTWLL